MLEKYSKLFFVALLVLGFFSMASIPQSKRNSENQAPYDSGNDESPDNGELYGWDHNFECTGNPGADCLIGERQ